ncbi:MAG: hypothetical protein M3437_19905, partial [Chloroflexota bacterium]|nr:hypothetical protein [Chloroflexota bacterium]
DDAYRGRLVRNLTNEVVRHFWEEEYGGRQAAGQVQMRASTGNKIRAFLSNPLLYHIVGQSNTTVAFTKVC